MVECVPSPSHTERTKRYLRFITFTTRAALALPAVMGWYRMRERSFAPWSQAFGEPATVSLV